MIIRVIALYLIVSVLLYRLDDEDERVKAMREQIRKEGYHV